MNVKIKLDEDPLLDEPEVLIRYARMNRMIHRLVGVIKSVDQTVRCAQTAGRSGEHWVNASEIYYLESVDKRTYVYCASAVYPTEMRLYQLMDQLREAGFVQISKSCIVNLSVLESIRPLANSRMEARLLNGERLSVTRRYVKAIRERLQEG